MAHKKIINSVKKHGQVAIKDLDEFLRFVINESDMRTYDDNYISILIPMKFDIDKVFGLDVCKRSDDDYVILYSCWYPNKDVFGRQFEMRLYHYDNSNDDDDLGLDIVMALALEPWLYNHCTDVPFVTFALQGVQNEAERYRYLQWLKAEIQ